MTTDEKVKEFLIIVDAVVKMSVEEFKQKTVGKSLKQLYVMCLALKFNNHPLEYKQKVVTEDWSWDKLIADLWDK